jgi:hypothetical protein
MPRDYSNLKLGKGPAKRDARTLRLGNYLDLEVLPPPPLEIRYYENMHGQWPMLRNNQLSDCTICGPLHGFQLINVLCGRTFTPTDEMAVQGYIDFCGYNPSAPLDEYGNNPTDQGGIMLDVLKQFQKVGIDGHKIGAFVSIDMDNDWQVKKAIELFSCVIVGAGLPLIAQRQDVWTPVRGYQGEPWGWGGHCFLYTGYFYEHHRHIYMGATWDEDKRLTFGFDHKYTDEGYAIVTTEQLNEAGQSITGLKMEELVRDLERVTQRPRHGAGSREQGVRSGENVQRSTSNVQRRIRKKRKSRQSGSDSPE